MDGKSKAIALLAAAIALASLLGLLQLFSLGLDSGEVYPPYSSFRSDPLGARAFYGALGSLPGVGAARNLAPITYLSGGPDQTLIFLGASQSKDPVEVIDKLDAFIIGGGRVVITQYPERGVDFIESLFKGLEAPVEDEQVDDGDTATDPIADGDADEPDESVAFDDFFEVKIVSIEDRWGFTYERMSLGTTIENAVPGAQAARVSGPDDLPPTLSWHSEIYFGNLAPEWNVLYRVDDHAVLMERKLGRGTIAIASDSYFVSNQAMREDRHSALLAWLVGPSSVALFDETHLGTREAPGIMVMIRRYRLDWFMGALAVVVALFVWRNASSLAPRRALYQENTEALLGKDAAAGLVNLLRRSIPPGKALGVCFDEWRKSAGLAAAAGAPKLKRVQAVVENEAAKPFTQRDPARAYREIRAILSERN